MTVGTEDREVLQTIVGCYPVDVVQGEEESTTTPLCEATLFTCRALQPCRYEPALDVRATPRGAAGQQLFEWYGVRSRNNSTATSGFRPRAACEAEPLLTLRDAVSSVVIRLDGRPVISPAAGGCTGESKPLCVVGDRRFCDAKAIADGCVRQTKRQQFADLGARLASFPRTSG